MADSSCSSSTSETVGRVMVQFKKNHPETLTDFGASLKSTGGPDGEHSLIEIDLSGLAWAAGFRPNDVVEAINAPELDVKNVDHHALLEYLRETGRTCSMLIKRKEENAENAENAESTYLWIAFKDKQVGSEATVARNDQRSVGIDISQAAAVYLGLLRWARKTIFSTLKFQHYSTAQVHLIRQKNNQDQYLGFFVNQSSRAEPKFTNHAFVLNMHTYQSVNYTEKIIVVAFSAIPRRNGAEASTEEESIFGYTRGAMRLKNFPSRMTNSEKEIPANSRMFRCSLNGDQVTGLLWSAFNKTEELYISETSEQACLGTKKSQLEIRTVAFI